MYVFHPFEHLIFPVLQRQDQSWRHPSNFHTGPSHKELAVLAGRLPAPQGGIILQDRWGKPPSWHWGDMFRTGEQLWELAKASKWYCEAFFLIFSSQNVQLGGEHPKLIPPASISWEYGKQSPFIRARNLIQPQGKKFSHDKVHGAWNMVWRKGPFTTTSVQHTCGRNYLRKRRDQCPPLPSSGEMWTSVTPPPKSPTELL